MTESLKKTFISGTFWTSGQQAIITLIGVLQLALTSRMLTPADFGTYAVATFFSSLGNVAFAMGFSAALIQKKGDIRSYLNTTWTASIAVASIASLLIIALVPLLCSYYFHNKGAMLPSVVIMLNGIFVAASNPGIILYYKEIQLKKIAILNIYAKVISFFLVILFVLVLKSYWGLIIAILSESIFRFLYSYILHPYRPKIQFDRLKFRELYAFSGWIQLKNITAWLAGSLDTAVVGNILGTSKLGFYNRAQTLASYPRLLINSVVDSVAYPLYAKVIDNQNKIQSVFNNIQDGILLLVGAMALVLVSFGYPIISLLLGCQWTVMVGPFRILLLSYLIQTLFLSFIPVLRAYGFTRQEFAMYLFQIILMTFLLYVFVNKYDLMGAGFATMLCLTLIYPGMIIYVKSKTQLKMGHYLTSLFVVSMSSFTIMTIFSLFDIISHGIILWIFEAIFVCMLYLGLVYVIWKVFRIGPGAILNVKSLLGRA